MRATLRTLEQHVQPRRKRWQRPERRFAFARHADDGGPVELRLGNGPGAPVLTVASVDEARRIANDDGRELLVIVDPNGNPDTLPWEHPWEAAP